MWEHVVAVSRDMSSFCAAHGQHLGVERVRWINRLLSGFAVCLTEYVVGARGRGHIIPLRCILPEHEGLIMASASPPVRVTQLLLDTTTQIPDSEDGIFSQRDRSALNAMVSTLQKTVAQGERLVQTPIPQSYVRHTTRFLTLWLATLPFGLWHVVGWWTPAVILAVSWALIGIHDLGLGIENPFTGPQSLRLFVMCSAVHSAVTDAMYGMTFGGLTGLGRALREFDVQAKDKLMGRTPLHHAAYTGDVQVARCLLAAGAEVNAVDSWDGSTPMDVARARGHKGVEQHLSGAGGIANVFEDTLRAKPCSGKRLPWQRELHAAYP